VHPRATDPFFGIGALKLSDPAQLLREVQLLRDRREDRRELHWATFDKSGSRGEDERLEFGKAVIDLVFDSNDARFCFHIADRRNGDLTGRFGNSPHAGELAYEALAAQVVRDMIDEEEIISIIADRRSTSPKVNFERDLANAINTAESRLAVASVCRMDSRSTDALQVVDLLLGAATLDLRQGRTETGSQKQLLLAHLLERCDCASFRPVGRSDPQGKWKVKLLARSRKARRKHRGGSAHT
jgi:hypothetical protein